MASDNGAPSCWTPRLASTLANAAVSPWMPPRRSQYTGAEASTWRRATVYFSRLTHAVADELLEVRTQSPLPPRCRPAWTVDQKVRREEPAVRPRRLQRLRN